MEDKELTRFLDALERMDEKHAAEKRALVGGFRDIVGGGQSPMDMGDEAYERYKSRKRVR